MFPGLTIFMVFILYYAFRRHQIEHKEEERKSEFWSRENRASNTRRMDISNLDYISVPLDSFPIGQYSNEELAFCEEHLKTLSQKRIFNLTGVSNTEIMLTYGAGNLVELGSYDDNFTELVRVISQYGELLASQNHINEAVTVLEFGIKIQSDITSNYVLLAELYQQKGDGKKIRSLIETAKILNSLSKDVILEKLEVML